MGADGSPRTWRPDLPRAVPAASGTAVRTRGQQRQLLHRSCLARPRRADVPLLPMPARCRRSAQPTRVMFCTGDLFCPRANRARSLCAGSSTARARRQGPAPLNRGRERSTPALSTEHMALGRGFQKMKEAPGRVSKHRTWWKEREELCRAAAWASSRLSARARLRTQPGFASHVPHHGSATGVGACGTPGTQHQCLSCARMGIAS